MGKFRSKLKRNSKGKTWAKGHSATSNPTNMKHRMKAKSRFFQANLTLAPQEEKKDTLTEEALLKHDACQNYLNNNENKEPTVNDIEKSLKSVNLGQNSYGGDDEIISESQSENTFGTFETFASNFTSCSNISFKRFLNNFNMKSDLKKEMLVLLASLTDIIKEKGLIESSTPYFLLLMERLEESNEEKDIIPSILLLFMGMKTVPKAVLREKFSKTADILLEHLKKFSESENKSIIKHIIGCMSILLRAQKHETWEFSSTMQYFDSILAFTIHSKPKIRKAAQHNISSIIFGSSFIKSNETIENKIQSYHPAITRTAKFCISKLNSETIVTSQTVVLHTLGLLNFLIKAFPNDKICEICEKLLSMISATNIVLRTKCYQVLHSLFASKTKNLDAIICGKLISAIFDYRPDKLDVRQTIAWLTVLKEGYFHLNELNTSICLNSLPKLIEVCTTELWMTDRSELINSVSLTVKDVLIECVKPVCNTEETAKEYKKPIEKIISYIFRALNTPFGEYLKHVILTCGILFECVGKHFSYALEELLLSLGNRYESQNQLTVQIEHSIEAAIKHLGPENVLKAIPLTNKKNEILLDRSWLLPLLREGTNNSTLEFFKNYILALAVNCNEKWCYFVKENKKALSHTYELLCCQLWGLFPGFCRNPKDIYNFKVISKTLAVALKENPEFRAPILDGFMELINSNEECRKEVGQFAKNFLPILFNIFIEKPKGTFEADLRKNMLKVIELYLTISSQPVLEDLFKSTLDKLSTVPTGTFESDAVLDILYLLLVHQSTEKLKEFLLTFMSPILKGGNAKHVVKDKEKSKKQQRKTYELLYNLLTEEKASCKNFCKKCKNIIQNILFDALKSVCPACQAIRLKCLKVLIENEENLTTSNALIKKTIPEAILTFKEFSTRKTNISQELVVLIGALYKKEEKLNDFIDIVLVGFGGDQVLISNTILALCSIVQNLRKDITVNTLDFILQQVMVFLVQKNRQHCEASVIFLITFVKVLPIPLIAKHLEFIMKSLSAMVPDTKRYCRITIGYLLKKLCKKFSAEELAKYVPGNDETTHKRLKKIRKLLKRENRKKLEQNNGEASNDSDDEFVSELEKKSLTINDILNDSDSDISVDFNEENKTNKKKQKEKSKNNELYIQEMPEDIVDLADVKSIGNIISAESLNENNLSCEKTINKKPKDPNRGFKVANDGRLIISDKNVNKNNSDSDSDDSDDRNENIEEKFSKANKRSFDDGSSSEENEEMHIYKRKKISDKSTVASGKSNKSFKTEKSIKSNATSKYKAGGKGIHRPINDNNSVKSTYGSEYKSTKAKGDMKKKGKPDPYAYIPLSRKILNKRKRAKSAGQFKNIVKGARKGALKGVKNKIHKKYKY